jgi:hypothetical protein
MKPVTLKALLDGDFENALIAATPGGIEAQEKRRQESLVASDVLPRRTPNCTREQLELLGIVFGDNADDLFVYCTLPAGWKKKPTDHSMWSKLIDDKGRERAMIFYKAAFYDRDAFIDLVARFCRVHRPLGGYTDDYKADQEKPIVGMVLDQGRVIWQTEEMADRGDWKKQDELDQQTKQWLDKNCPDWENPLAYWDWSW